MPNTGTAPGLAKATTHINPDRGSLKPKPELSIDVLQGARCFFWIAGLVCVNSVFEVLGSQVHRFTGFGLAEVVGVVGELEQPSGISVMPAIVSFWVAGGFLLLGYLALEGRKWAFAAGMAAYAVDAALMVAVGDYLGAVFHGLMLYGIYRGFVALGQSSSAGPSEVASAAHAG